MPSSEHDERQAQTLPRLRLQTRVLTVGLTLGAAITTAAWMLRLPEDTPLAQTAVPAQQTTDHNPVGTIAPIERTENSRSTIQQTEPGENADVRDATPYR